MHANSPPSGQAADHAGAQVSACHLRVAPATACQDAWFGLLHTIERDGRGRTMTWKLFVASAAAIMGQITTAGIVASRLRPIASSRETLALVAPERPQTRAAFDLARCPSDRADAARVVQLFLQLQRTHGLIETCEALFTVGCSAGAVEGLDTVLSYIATLADRYDQLAAAEATQTRH